MRRGSRNREDPPRAPRPGAGDEDTGGGRSSPADGEPCPDPDGEAPEPAAAPSLPDRPEDAGAAAGPLPHPAGPAAEAGDAPSPAPTGGPDRPPDPAAVYLDQLQRVKAEFDNYRRRTAREREQWSLESRAEVLRRLMPVLDDLRRAREHGRAPGEAPDAAGLWLILKRLEEIVAQLGLEEQDASPGTEFDPERHAAVLTAASEEIPEGRILHAVEPGFLLEGKLLRPSKVAVSSGPPE